MIVRVMVIPNAKRDEITEEDGIMIVRLAAHPEKGKANKALIKLLEGYYNARVRIISGERSRNKVVEIIPRSL